MKKKYSATCPLYHRGSVSDNMKKRSKLLEYIFPGYETCESGELFDMSTQTDIRMSEWDDYYFESNLQRLASKTSAHDNPPLEEFIDIIESGDEEFFSIGDEKVPEVNSGKPECINIQLNDSPHIIMTNGTEKTKISLTPEYLERNGLELVIGEGPSRNVILKAGESEIYPSDKVLPNGVSVTVDDVHESDQNKEGTRQRGIRDKEPATHKVPTDIDFPSSKLRIGLLSLAVDELEQSYLNDLLQQNNETAYPVPKLIQCISDELYTKPKEYRYGKKERLNKTEPKDDGEEMTLKDGKRETYKKVKNNFFWTALEGNPAIDRIKKEVIDELAKHDFQFPPEEPSNRTIEVQTEVHINPNTTSEDYTNTDDSDPFLRRFYVLRGKNTINNNEASPNGNRLNETNLGKTNTHETTTIGQIESDFSTKTEPTLDGIPELTDRNDATKDLLRTDMYSDKDDVTDDGVSEISEKRGGRSRSMTPVVKKSKATGTEDLDDDAVVSDVAVMPEKPISSPSIIKTLESFEEALGPLKAELSRLHTEFKSIDIPDDLKLSVSDNISELPPPQPYTNPYQPTPETYRPFYEPLTGLNRLYPSSMQLSPTRGDPCSCPSNACLGIRRSTGVECRRVRRLPPQASTSEFFREFTRPAWIRNNVYTPDSIWSEPEDILGNSPQQPSTSRNNLENDNKQNKF